MRFSLRQTLAAVVLIFLLSGCGPKSLQVSGAWARPAAAGDNSAAYFTIENPTSQADTLLSAACDVTDQAELHMSSMEGGVMSMTPQENVPVDANSQVAFAPGGLHVMLLNLKQDLKVGDKFDLTLNFQHAGAVKVSVEVKNQ